MGPTPALQGRLCLLPPLRLKDGSLATVDALFSQMRLSAWADSRAGRDAHDRRLERGDEAVPSRWRLFFLSPSSSTFCLGDSGRSATTACSRLPTSRPDSRSPSAS